MDVLSVALSPRGNRLVAVAGGVTRLWRVGDGNAELPGRPLEKAHLQDGALVSARELMIEHLPWLQHPHAVEARRCMMTGDYTGLVAHCDALGGVASDTVRRIRPKLAADIVAEAWGASGRAAYRKAERLADVALSLDPSSVSAVRLRGRVLAAKGQLGEAADVYRQVLKLAPDSHGTLRDLGSACERSGNLREAFECYEQYLRLVVEHADPARMLTKRIELARLYWSSGRTDRSIALLEECFQADPSSRQACVALASAYCGAGRYEEASELAKGLVPPPLPPAPKGPPRPGYFRPPARQPSGDALLLAAVCLHARGDPDGARQCVRQLMREEDTPVRPPANRDEPWPTAPRPRLRPPRDEPWEAVRDLAAFGVDPEEALLEVTASDSALSQRVKAALARVYAWRAEQLAGTGDREAASAAIGRALELGPDVAAVRHRISCALSQLGALDRATDHARQAVTIDPGLAEGWADLGWQLYCSGRRAEALAATTRSLKLNPEFGSALIALAVQQAADGHFEEASRQVSRTSSARTRTQLLSTALDRLTALSETRDDLPGLLLVIGDVYKAMSDQFSAREHYQRYLDAEGEGRLADRARSSLANLTGP